VQELIALSGASVGIGNLSSLRLLVAINPSMAKPLIEYAILVIVRGPSPVYE